MLWSSINYEYIASLDSTTLSRRCNTAHFFTMCASLCLHSSISGISIA